MAVPAPKPRAPLRIALDRQAVLRVLLLCLCCCAVWFRSSALQAQLLSGDKATAQTLLEEARRLVDQRHYATACVKLEESRALDPAPATQLRLADCYEKIGRTASAWSLFRETAAIARRASEPEREHAARKRAKDLQSHLSYLTVITWKGQDIDVARDGSELDAALVGTALPVDPGTHKIVASAPGKRSWTTTVNVRGGADRVTVSVPILTDDPAAAASANPTPNLRAATDTRTEADYGVPPPSTGGVQRAFAIAAAALGVAGVATGAVFGLKARSTDNEAKAQCTAPGFEYPSCNESAAQLHDEAAQSRQISTIGLIAGGAGVAAAALLWLTAPSSPTSPISPSTSRVSLALNPLALDLRAQF